MLLTGKISKLCLRVSPKISFKKYTILNRKKQYFFAILCFRTDGQREKPVSYAGVYYCRNGVFSAGRAPAYLRTQPVFLAASATALATEAATDLSRALGMI